ncbi:DNA cytosine methyltransferase [Nonomuraea diastatica]|uniref:DNA cytosine methyltransferase n=1 Tax=Nonomuraea diastatica TaxID=1848329 RepID=A0A4R4V9J5_9ACTN|nr:DNA cytosine methyltransferase [Nonomuraea diastatica]TDD01999.1 DNA cytosine methyltransferase [Nonomuraea diastatica]
MILALYAGPGGIDQGARILGIRQPLHGYDIDADTSATATAAGFRRTQASVPELDPEDFPTVTGAIITPPCPPFSRGGLGKGMTDFPAIRNALTLLGDNIAGMVSDDAYQAALADLHDPRSALLVETLRFAFRLPKVRWMVAEQVPAVAPLWQEISAELAMTTNWTYLAVLTVAAQDLGVASCRTRTFLIATRSYAPDLTGLPTRALWTTGRFAPPRDELPPAGHRFPAATMAAAIGWPAGERVNTRGNRRTSGGNEFSADGPSWCLTSKARSWKRVSDGTPLTASQAGLLTGFPADYPWQGSRSKQFLQAADVVSPPVAAAVLGSTLGIDWQPAIRAYLASIYPRAGDVPPVLQSSLFDLIGAAS